MNQSISNTVTSALIDDEMDMLDTDLRSPLKHLLQVVTYHNDCQTECD